jgi:3-(3-hydroxy-phenyl)propionate hydroxylase
MTSSLICDVAVIGAGPTGLTLANLLGQAGIRVIVLERNENTVKSPRAVSIDDESLRTIQAIDLIGDVLRNVATDYGSHYFTTRGRCFVSVEPTTREYGFPRRNAFTQPHLEQALLEGLGRFPNVTILFQHTVASLSESPEGVGLRVQTHEGSDLYIQARYIAACDGAKSTIRKHIGATMTGYSYPQRWLIIDLATTQERLRQTRVICDPKRPLITLPGPHGIRRYEFMLRDNEDDAMATQPDFIRDLLAAYGPDIDSPIVRAQVYAFHALIANKWNTNRIFLAGDAAHLSPPFAGQGMNSGIRDAFNLSWKFVAVVKGNFGSKLLETYHEERAPHAWSLIQLAVKMGRVMMPKSRLRAWLVQNAFRLTRFAPGIQSYFAQMKYKPKPFYRHGFIIPAKGDALAGRMLPQPFIETKDGRVCLLDERLGNQFRLIAYGEKAQTLLEEACSYDFGLSNLQPLAILPSIFNSDRNASSAIEVVRDINGTLAAFIPTDSTVLMLLRPDRYIVSSTSGSPAAMATNIRRLVQNYRGEIEPTPESVSI